MKNYYSKNKKLQRLLTSIDYQLEELGIDEIKRYMSDFPNEIDYNIAQYGNLLCYYSDVRELYRECGYTSMEKWSNEKIWNTYKRQVGYVARRLNPIIRL